MYLKKIFRGLLLCAVSYSSSAFAVTITGWGVVGNKLFQLGFDSDAGITAATRSLFTTLPASDINSMALSPDGNSLFAISATANTVYKVDVNTAATSSIGDIGTNFNLDGASTRGNEILLMNNGVIPAVWSLNMTDAALSTQIFNSTSSTSLGGRPHSLVNLNDNEVLFFTDGLNSSFRRRAWTMDNSGATTLLGTVLDPLGNEVQGFNASEMAADGKVYAMGSGRQVWEINYLGGSVTATQVDEFTPDGISAHGWSTLVFAPAAVPVPASVWLFGSGLLGLAGVARRKRS